ncbi:SusD/RagB family nutrient-binding outer membrane lipoprotein [Aurantibacter crassamenti]|uniref:SusD/RagB family nutrient-binding outer membrane lipoprotein n=1 Tax=Aurantibacter crassamenti TaxID=1837375 RepID=UPI00193AA4B1|nr:SusD/RagB family nutrient-binding outer membrane lipoprotein [Aurantibacter crassamenti]MBM1105753.1 SusD/RagB family nutrient-binding outer membrane lipoprotein [Aurantibacter crassamenti]
MKNIIKYITGAFLVLTFLGSCDDGFDELNTDKVRLISIDPTYQLNTAIIEGAPTYYNSLTYQTTIVRQMITPFAGVGTGANLNQDNRAATTELWNSGYRTTLKNLTDGIATLAEEPEKINLMSMLRIWRAHEFMILTDTYGDVPYFEAGQGFLEQIPFPKYTPQEQIYDDILKELDEASTALNPSQDAVNQEVMYAGAGIGDNISAWKRLGNSLLLRAAMRLVKVNPAKAQEYAAKAISAGIMNSNEDNALVRHDASFRNNIGTNLNGGQAPFYYLDKEFVDFLQNNDDPRLAAIAVRYVGSDSEGGQIPENANRDPSIQIGMPQGFDNTTIASQVAADGVASLFDYSQLDRTRLGAPEAPNFFVTYSATLLLHAEAIVRGWATGDANAVYQSAIRANMEQFADWPGNTAIAEDDITTYLAAHTLTPGSELEEINNQYWISTFLNGSESWANFRRSGFPNVLPNPYPGGELNTEAFIRRLTYPDGEKTVNSANLQEAISRQGPDNLESRVWWDQ